MARIAILIAIVSLLLVGLGQSPTFAVARLDGGGPAVFGTDKLVVVPGDVVTFTVHLSGPATGEEVFTFSAPTGAFTNLPETISPQPGATSVMFQATVSSNPQFGIQVVVSHGEVSISTPMMMWFDTTPDLEDPETP